VVLFGFRSARQWRAWGAPFDEERGGVLADGRDIVEADGAAAVPDAQAVGFVSGLGMPPGDLDDGVTEARSLGRRDPRRGASRLVRRTEGEGPMVGDAGDGICKSCKPVPWRPLSSRSTAFTRLRGSVRPFIATPFRVETSDDGGEAAGPPQDDDRSR